MASKVECDQYAVDLMKRFDELTQWAIAHWPRQDFPLLQSDFDAARREIGEILGPKLGDGDGEAQPPEQQNLLPPDKHGGQYIGVNPMPWP